MRPQHNAAENVAVKEEVAAVKDASMRPQHNAAENIRQGKCMVCGDDSFNEAAA